MIEGTKEWAEVNKNLFKGCKRDCRYCFARAMALRFGHIDSPDEWEEMERNKYSKRETAKKVDGRIMFPSTHDIVEDYLYETIRYLKRWLEVGNDILIVTKPNPVCVTEMCDELVEYRDQITFRFTITSPYDEDLEFWEPNSPNFECRFFSLKHAYNHDYTTSVSVEPYLDKDVGKLVEMLQPWVTDKIWVGKMNKINSRVDTSVWSEDDMRFMKKIERITEEKQMLEIYDEVEKRADVDVRYKDTFREVLEEHGKIG